MFQEGIFVLLDGLNSARSPLLYEAPGSSKRTLAAFSFIEVVLRNIWRWRESLGAVLPGSQAPQALVSPLITGSMIGFTELGIVVNLCS